MFGVFLAIAGWFLAVSWPFLGGFWAFLGVSWLFPGVFEKLSWVSRLSGSSFKRGVSVKTFSVKTFSVKTFLGPEPLTIFINLKP